MLKAGTGECHCDPDIEIVKVESPKDMMSVPEEHLKALADHIETPEFRSSIDHDQTGMVENKIPYRDQK